MGELLALLQRWLARPAPPEPDPEDETYQPGDRVPGWIDETN